MKWLQRLKFWAKSPDGKGSSGRKLVTAEDVAVLLANKQASDDKRIAEQYDEVMGLIDDAIITASRNGESNAYWYPSSKYNFTKAAYEVIRSDLLERGFNCSAVTSDERRTSLTIGMTVYLCVVLKDDK